MGALILIIFIFHFEEKSPSQNLAIFRFGGGGFGILGRIPHPQNTPESLFFYNIISYLKFSGVVLKKNIVYLFRSRFSIHPVFDASVDSA